MNYRLVWCTLCQDMHRPPQPAQHKAFHTDPFATRYIPEIPNQTCTNCSLAIRYNRHWGGWYHVDQLFRACPVQTIVTAAPPSRHAVR